MSRTTGYFKLARRGCFLDELRLVFFDGRDYASILGAWAEIEEYRRIVMHRGETGAKLVISWWATTMLVGPWMAKAEEIGVFRDDEPAANGAAA